MLFLRWFFVPPGGIIGSVVAIVKTRRGYFFFRGKTEVQILLRAPAKRGGTPGTRGCSGCNPSAVHLYKSWHGPGGRKDRITGPR